MDTYLLYISKQLERWKKEMRRNPSLINKSTSRIQQKFNDILPEAWHTSITRIIKEMVRGVIFGAQNLTRQPQLTGTLEEREMRIEQNIKDYQKTGAIEGAITGGAGFIMGMADFPLLLSIKIKLLFDIAAIYGHDVSNYKERVYILYIFQLAFSNAKTRKATFEQMENWEAFEQQIPNDIHQFDWRLFQQQYRDYLDIAKLAQLIPIIGAPIGAIVNYRLIKKLGYTAVQCYRMRWLETKVTS